MQQKLQIRACFLVYSFMMSQLNTPQHSKDLTLDLSDSKTYAYSFWFITQIPFFHFHSKCLHLFLKVWAAKICTAFRILHWLFSYLPLLNFLTDLIFPPVVFICIFPLFGIILFSPFNNIRSFSWERPPINQIHQ